MLWNKEQNKKKPCRNDFSFSFVPLKIVSKQRQRYSVHPTKVFIKVSKVQKTMLGRHIFV